MASIRSLALNPHPHIELIKCNKKEWYHSLLLLFHFLFPFFVSLLTQSKHCSLSLYTRLISCSWALERVQRISISTSSSVPRPWRRRENTPSQHIIISKPLTKDQSSPKTTLPETLPILNQSLTKDHSSLRPPFLKPYPS